MEEWVLRRLDFNLRSVPAIAFLERFFRIFGIDQNEKDANAGVIMDLANDYCSFIQRDSQFLDFRPSLNAAASLMLAFNVSQSHVAPSIGLKKIPEL